MIVSWKEKLIVSFFELKLGELKVLRLGLKIANQSRSSSLV